MIEEIYYRLRDMMSKPDERGERSAGYLQNKIRQAALELSKDYSGRLLEVGCGEGLFLSQLAAVNPAIDVWGVDNWPDILIRAKELLAKKGITNVHLTEAQAQSLPFEDSFFDVVIFINVIICMDSIDMVNVALAEISRVLKPGGRIVIEFRNKRNILLRAKYGLAKYYDATAKTHPLSTYYETEIIKSLSEAGFVTVFKKYIGLFAPVIILEAEKPQEQKHV